MASIDSLTDCEIRVKLTQLGYPVHPITATTRNVLLRKLKYLLEQSNLVGHVTNEVPTSFPRYRPSPRPSCEGRNVWMDTRNRQILHRKRVPGSGTGYAFGSFNKPGTSFGVTSTVFDTSGDSLSAATFQPTTALGVTALPFGQPRTTTSLGSSTTVDAAANTALGTLSAKFMVVMGTDTINGWLGTVRTRHHCITCMKEYESKSLEELRFEDYCTNAAIRTRFRQGVQSTEQPFVFGAGETTHGTSLLWSTNYKPVFGQTNTSTAVQPSLIGVTTSQPTIGFNTPTPVASTPATEDVFSIDVLKHSIDRLEEIVRCAVCLEAVKPTIVQCVNGHLMCSGCKRTLDKCPLCRASFSDYQPSRVIEQIIEALPSRCMWPNCKLYFKSGDDHELFCEYRLTRCMWDDCHWSGCRSEIYHHMSTEHTLFGDKTSISLNLITFPLDYFDPNIKYSCSTSYILVDGHIIIKKTVNDPGKKIFTETFYLLPNGKPQKDIYVEVLFTSKGPKFLCKIKLNFNQDALEENTIHVPWHMLPNFRDKERRLQYNIFITEE